MVSSTRLLFVAIIFALTLVIGTSVVRRVRAARANHVIANRSRSVMPTAPLAAFTSGNLAVFQADVASANNTTFSIVELSPTTAGQTTPGVQTISINGTSGVGALRTSGSATSTGYLATTNDGTLLSFDAHNSTTTSGNANALTARGVGTLNSAGGFALATTYTGISGNQARGATSLNNSSWFIADQGGVYTNGATTPSPTNNLRGIKSFGGVVYTLQQSSTASVIVVSTLSATSGGTVTGLPGLTNNNAAQDFYLISSGDNGAVFDVLYVNTNTSATAGTILKFSLVGGTWVANGSYTTSFGGFGLAAADNGNGALLYVSGGAGATAANSVIKLADTAGYNSTISITTANNVTLYTAPAGTTIKGVAFAPVGDAAPAVTTTSPVNGATNVATNSTIGINFTEPVNLAAGAVTLECPSGTPQTFTGLPASGVNNVTLTPSSPLPGGTVCTVTVVANQVTDVDAIDPPDNMAANFVFTFTTTAPANTPPMIVANTATTTTYLNLTGAGPANVSGVLNDPTDPATTLGIDFTIADAETAAGSLGFAATSSNTAVVPNNPANLVLSGSGASRNLKIVPTAVGYATITVTVTDASSATATYTINYAASAASATPATTFFYTGTSDGSAAIAVDANFMFVADDENQGLRLYSRAHSGMPSYVLDPSPSLNLTDPANPEVDIEAATQVGSRIYWLGSHSNSANAGHFRVNRYRLFATDLVGSGASATLSYVGRYDGLRTDLINWDHTNAHGLGVDHYGFQASTADGVIPEAAGGVGFNMEGMVMAPGSTTTAYLCFRAPISPANNRTKALIVPVTNFDTLVTGNPSAGPAIFGAPIELDLGGRGIRDVAKNASDQYVIIAGPFADATGIPPSDFRLYSWTGIPTDAPLLRNAALGGLNPEGIVEVPAGLNASSTLQIISDGGDTILYNDGQIAKDLAQPNFKKFRSDIITLGPAAPTASNGTISGTIVTAEGQPVEGVVVRLSGAQARKTITDANGNYHFDNIETEGFYSVTPLRSNYTLIPFSRSFSQVGNKTTAAFTASSNGETRNPLDTAEYFVRQQYVDILGREPDEAGFNYWSDRILACGSDASCGNTRRREVAAAFFIEEETQDTRSFIFDVYAGALGRRPSFVEYSSDRPQIVGGANLNHEKDLFTRSFVQRTEFGRKYSEAVTAEAFVDALFRNLSQSYSFDLSAVRASLIDAYNEGMTQDQSRGRVIRTIADNQGFKRSLYNSAFVLTEYFGYLRRDPEPGGYDFWLNVLSNSDVGNYRGMVCSFITSAEYQRRFSVIVAHNNLECDHQDR